MNFLPGWHPGFFAAGSANDVLDFVDFTFSSAATIAHPASVLAGDLLFIVHCGSDEDATAPAQVTPSGYTLLGTATDSSGGVSLRLSVHYKVAAGTEGGTSVNVINGNNTYISPNQQSFCLQYRRDPTPIASINVVDLSQAADIDAALLDETITASAGAAPLIAIAAGQVNPFDFSTGNADSIIMAGSTESVLSADGEANGLAWYGKISQPADTPANVSVTAGDAYALICAYVEIT